VAECPVATLRPFAWDPSAAAIVREVERFPQRAPSALEIDLMVIDLLLALQRVARPGFRETERRRLRAVADVQLYIASNLDRPLTLGELAQVSGLSAFHFARSFRDSAGLAPHQYVLAERVASAARMLAEGATVTDAGIATGFSSTSHFISTFRRLKGTTPGAYSREGPPA